MVLAVAPGAGIQTSRIASLYGVSASPDGPQDAEPGVGVVVADGVAVEVEIAVAVLVAVTVGVGVSVGSSGVAVREGVA